MPTSTTPSGQNALISLLTAAEMQVLSGTPITRKEWLNLEQLTVR